MNLARTLITPTVHDALAMRAAGPELLELALMDARSRTLAWLQVLEDLHWRQPFAEFDPPLWLIGHAAWFQEHSIARHVQRERGEAAEARSPRLPSIEPEADVWFDPSTRGRADRWHDPGPDVETLRAYLAATLDATLELLDRLVDRVGAGDTAADDALLHVYRVALHHEDLLGEQLAVLSQVLDIDEARLAPLDEGGWRPTLISRAPSEPVRLPAQRFQLGSPPGGWVPRAERWAHAAQVAAFDIDAHPVRWADYLEFVQDGGYDDRAHWTDAGWDWLEQTTRRAPRYVEQMLGIGAPATVPASPTGPAAGAGGGVLVRRHGRLRRVPLGQPVTHVSAHEAAAWCRWAGRRLPTEAEWELAALQARAQGHRWGEVLEWVADDAAPYPEGAATAPQDAAALRGRRVLRGASLWASRRLAHPRARRFAPPTADVLHVGFRSCG